MAVIAVISFIAAVSIYFVGSFRNTEREYAVYTTMEEPTLPIIFAEIDGSYGNAMHGYMQEMGNKAASDSITPLPEDRRLGLKLKLYDNVITELSYEVRSLDLEHYIEKTAVDVPQKDNAGDVYVELPIQNMIDKDTQYLLKINLRMGEKTVNYYTRIIWTDSDDISRMLQMARNFSAKTFNYDEARELAVYLESSESEDNSSLDTVRISSSFSQLTWGDSGMKLEGEQEFTIKEYDGMMGAIEVKYRTETPGSDSENPDIYNNTDEFTMRAASDRVYLMNYVRSTSQIFDGSKHLFAGNRIRLGIISKDKLQTLKSENGRFTVFKSDKELWSYDSSAKKAVNVFTFRSENDSIRAAYDNFDIKILSVNDDGNIDFVVYGYMNRGRHEGCNGITYCRYLGSNQTIEEICFIPIADNYENIKNELNKLCSKNSTGNLYIKQQDAIYAIDGNSLELMSFASGLTTDSYAISKDQTKIAWVEGDIYSTNSIRLTNLEDNTTKTINAEPDTVLTVLGFCNNDLIYGVRGVNDNLTVNGKIKGRPVYAVYIVDAELNPVMEYRKDGLYFEEVRVDGDRIHLAQYRKGDNDGEYNFVSRDTIVSSKISRDNYTQYISSSDSETMKKMYYVDLDENIKTTRSLDVISPKNISYEKSGDVELSNLKRNDDTQYYAYANGKMIGKCDNLKSAIDLCYDGIGWVRDENCAVLYNRADRSSIYTIKEPYSTAADFIASRSEGTLEIGKVNSSGYIVLDAQGLELNKLMYYIGKGVPVMAELDSGNYCLLYAYNRDSIGIMYPSENAEESTTASMELTEAAQYFANYNSDFTCFVRYPGK